jgi:hypothetical protein
MGLFETISGLGLIWVGLLLWGICSVLLRVFGAEIGGIAIALLLIPIVVIGLVINSVATNVAQGVTNNGVTCQLGRAGCYRQVGEASSRRRSEISK